MRPAVFLDRDDTILDTRRVTAGDAVPGDLVDASRVALMPGAAGAVGRLKAAGFAVVVFSSQGCVARGTGTLRDVEAVNERMRALIVEEWARMGLVGSNGEHENPPPTPSLGEGEKRKAGGDTRPTNRCPTAARVFDSVYFCPFHPKGSVSAYAREDGWRKPSGGMIVAAASELGLDLSRSWAVGDKPRDAEAAVNGGIARERTIVIRTSGEDGRCADLVEAVEVIVRGEG